MTKDEHKERILARLDEMSFHKILVDELARISAALEQIRTGNWASEEYDHLFKPGAK